MVFIVGLVVYLLAIHVSNCKMHLDTFLLPFNAPRGLVLPSSVLTLCQPSEVTDSVWLAQGPLGGLSSQSGDSNQCLQSASLKHIAVHHTAS